MHSISCCWHTYPFHSLMAHCNDLLVLYSGSTRLQHSLFKPWSCNIYEYGHAGGCNEFGGYTVILKWYITLYAIYFLNIAINIILNMLINDGIILMCVHRRDSASLLQNAILYPANLMFYTEVESKQSYLCIQLLFLLSYILFMIFTLVIFHATMTHALFLWWGG